MNNWPNKLILSKEESMGRSNKFNFSKMCSSGAYIEEIMGNSTENIVCISVFLISSYYWRLVKHYFSGSLKEISDCQYLVNGLKGMKKSIPEEKFSLRKLYFEFRIAAV